MASKCSSGSCPQAVFRDGLCIDHFRKEKGTSGSKLVIPGKDEVITDEMRKKFREVTSKIYVEQAKWFLNAFWLEGGEAAAEEVWATAHKFTELDKKKKQGNELNEVEAHHFLQQGGKTMTALELRNELRRIDMDANGMMALIEYLMFQYKKGVGPCLNNPQGSFDEKEKKLLDEAQAKCDALSKAVEELTKQVANEQAAEAKAKQAEEEAKAAAAELQRQEDDYKQKVGALETKSTDSSLGIVVRNKAAQELAQLKSQDPLPLRKAKITQDACVRKVAEARKVQEEQTRKVEAAFAETEQKFKEAQDFLEEMKKKASAPQGALWWLQREVQEQRRYMPKSRQ